MCEAPLNHVFLFWFVPHTHLLENDQTVSGNEAYGVTGSIVTETLKNEILIPIDISKELNYYSDFKYVGFIKFCFTN